MPETRRRDGAADSPVAAYKRILQRIIELRPSGTRQRLAAAIGKNRSFISQICNPNYPTPIPVEHIDQIVRVCHFSPNELDEFMAAYQQAHPRRLQRLEPESKGRRLTIDVPDFGDDAINRAFDQTIADMAKRIGKLVRDRG